MKERFYRALNIKTSESGQVFDLLTVQFFIGLANALVSIIALSLFVYSFPVSSLPLVYLVIAVILFLFNFIYEKLEHRYTPTQLLKYIIAFAAVMLLLIWVGLAFVNKHSFIFILQVTGVLIYMITGYAFWGLVSQLFNVRESRRVFSIIGSGDIPAKLIGYLAAPLLIPFIGLPNLLWLAILSLVYGLYLFHKYLKKKSWDVIKAKAHQEEHHQHAEDIFNRKDFVSFFFKNKLIFAISLLSLLSYNVFVLVDFTFISQVKNSFANISELAVYIAIFFALGRLIALAFKLIFTSRVIERLGVIYSLFVTPVALFLFCLVFFFFGSSSTINLYIFGLMTMLTEVLRSTIQEPVFFILFQPLKENLRLKGHIISKGYMYPPSLIIVGLSLFFLYRTETPITILLSVKIVIINLCVWAGIIFFIGRTYLSTVHASIRKGTFSSDGVYITDPHTLEILLKKIASGETSEVIYALNLLEKSGYPGMKVLLEKLLEEGRDVAVQRYVLERMEASGKLNLAVLKNMINTAEDTALRQKLYALLCKHDFSFLNKVSENISGHDYPVRKIVIINLLNQHEFNYLYKAGNEINNLLHSSKPVERELAVEIISELKHVQFTDAIATLMHDREHGVRRMAIITAGKLRMKRLLPGIIKLLDNPAERNIVLQGLQLYGDQLFEDLDELPGTVTAGYQADFIRIAARVKGGYSADYLLDKLHLDNPVLNDKAIHALWMNEYEPDSFSEKEKFGSLIQRHLKMGMEKLQEHNHIPDFSDKELIKRSIYNEVKNDLALALKLSAMLYGKKEINRILELMETGKQDKLYNAMEMIELLLPKKVSKDLNFIFDFILDPGHNSAGNIRKGIDEFFVKAMFDTPLHYNPWTKAVCVYSSWRNNYTGILQKLEEYASTDDHFLVRETRDYVLHNPNLN